jgi:pimeloyl-ACP methyl ester carboxylesterase
VAAVAIALAADKPVGRIVLEAPFTSAADVGAHYRFVPVRLFMKDQFRSDLRVGKVTAPVLVVHGENDFVVPMTLGKRLYGLIPAPKRFVSIADAGHNDLGTRAVAAAKEFIAEQDHVCHWR